MVSNDLWPNPSKRGPGPPLSRAVVNRTPDTREEAADKLPALHVMMVMGWVYVSPARALAMRGSERGSFCCRFCGNGWSGTGSAAMIRTIRFHRRPSTWKSMKHRRPVCPRVCWLRTERSILAPDREVSLITSPFYRAHVLTTGSTPPAGPAIRGYSCRWSSPCVHGQGSSTMP